MNTYKVTYTNIFTPYATQHSTEQAESLDDLLGMMHTTGAIVSNVDIDIPAIQIAAYVAEYEAQHAPQDDPITRVSMEERHALLMGEVKKMVDNGVYSGITWGAVWSEIDEIDTWLGKDDQAIDDVGDAKLCARFGTSS